MTKIAKIEIADFRGFDSVRTFDFEDADIIIFLGMNGFGKTSIFDAVEWCLTGRISRYETYLTGGRKQDFSREKQVLRNKYASDPHALVKIELTDGKKFGRRVIVGDNGSDYNTGSIIDSYAYGINEIATQNIDLDVINNYFSATHILSQETIHHFVTSKKPEDRYRALSVNFGTSLYEPFDDNAQRLLSTLKAREDVHSRKIEEALVRLRDFEDQKKEKSEEIEGKISSANEIIHAINSISPNTIASNYHLDESKSKIIGASSEDIQKILSSIKSNTDEATLKISILKSLSNELDEWISKNKELSELDKKIIENKQLISKLKELEASKFNLENEFSQISRAIQQELSNKNIADFVSTNLKQFLENKAKIDLFSKEVSERNAVASEAQQTISKLMESLSLLGKKLRDTSNWLQHADALKKEVNAFSSKYSKKYNFEKIISSSQESISAAREQLKNLQSSEALVSSNWLSLDAHKIDQLKAADPSIDIQPLREQIEKTISLRNVESQINALIKDKEKLTLEHESLIKNLSKSQAMLANALELIPESEVESQCPVCSSSHETQNLLNIIKSKINRAETAALEELNSKLKRLDNDLSLKRDENAQLLQDVSLAKSNIPQIFQARTIELRSAIENSNTDLLAARSEVQQLESEKLRLTTAAISLLNNDSIKWDEIIFLIDQRTDSESKDIAEIKSSIGDLENQKTEIEKTIELQLSSNRLAQEQISEAQSAEYERINSFLLEKGFSIDANLEAKINNHLIELTSTCDSLTQRLQRISESKNENQQKIDELKMQKASDQIENEIALLLERVSEINRFLSNFKERSIRVDIDLGNINPEIIYEINEKHNKTISENKKCSDLLSSLLEMARTFLIFSNEDQLRKRIIEVKNSLERLKEELSRIIAAKNKIDGLKKQFPKMLEKYITENLDVKLFNQIYRSLNPHRRFKEIDFKVDVSHNKVGINFNAMDSTLNARPEFLFSSAQLNTFGVSMFLSMALRQNWLNLDTVLLDDPIQNLDDINVLSLIDLIRGLLDLKSKQVVLSTHDERFYNLVKRKFADYKLKAFKFESYGRVMPDS